MHESVNLRVCIVSNTHPFVTPRAHPHHPKWHTALPPIAHDAQAAIAMANTALHAAVKAGSAAPA